MHGRTLLFLAILLGASPAAAASFPCAKASTPSEKAICADQGLSVLDERLAATYRKAMDLLGGASPEEGPARAAVKADQRAWLADRNACGGDSSCLRTAYERRLAVLSFRPDPGAPGPADRYVGTFDHGGFMGISAIALRDGGVAVSVSGAEPSSARWVCDFSGVGRLNGSGALVVGTPNDEGDGLILVGGDGKTVTIPDHPANHAAGSTWCGMNGSFAFSYRRKP